MMYKNLPDFQSVNSSTAEKK